MSERKKKLIVILSGGGAKASFQVGAWNQILNNGISLSGEHRKVRYPDAVFGVSGGAINGVMMAMGKNKELIKMWNHIAGNPSEIYTSEFLKNNNGKPSVDFEKLLKFGLSEIKGVQKMGLLFKKPRKKLLGKVFEKLLSLKGLSSNQPLFEKLQKLVRRSDVKSDVFKAGFVSLTDGKYYSFSHDSFDTDLQLQKAVLASSSMPLIWNPVDNVKSDFELTNLIDGGIRNVTPFSDAINYIQSQNEDCDYHFLVISCHLETLPPLTENPNLIQIVSRGIYDIALDEIRKTDLKNFLRINQLVKQAKDKGVKLFDRKGKELKSYKVKIIRPSRKLSFALDFSRNAIMDSFAHGFHRASEVLSEKDWE